MNLEDRILRYTVRIDQNSYQPYFRSIKLALESGHTASIFFGQERPETFLEFTSTGTNLYMTTDQFTDVYHMIQTESPVFFTAIDFEGIQTGAVHTELDLRQGEWPGEGETDPSTFEGLVLRVRGLEPEGHAPATQ